jgi:hypothetical protein
VLQRLKNVVLAGDRASVTAELPVDGWTSVDAAVRLSVDGQLFTPVEQGKFKLSLKPGK